ncbi:MAG: hypothetical protein D6698_16235 [Gammaproteobacteria bacterium]|nr:MAG: hypothetical protein D6698_16235 [Gammaproteobacteria bacterium]
MASNDYVINDSKGNIVTTIPPGGSTGSTLPLVFVGRGTTNYGEIIWEAFYKLLENFTNGSQPSSPVKGMLWYNDATDTMFYYDGNSFVPLSSLSSSSAGLFPMDSAATNLDLTAATTTAVFTNSSSATYYPTGVMFIPNGTPTATTAANLNLKVAVSEDVLETVSVGISNATSHAYFAIQGTTKSVATGEALFVEVTTPATGGSLNVDVLVYGARR